MVVASGVMEFAGTAVMLRCNMFEAMYKSTSRLVPGVRNSVARFSPDGIPVVLMAQKPSGNVT